MSYQNRDPHVPSRHDNSWQGEPGTSRESYQDTNYDDIALTEDYLADKRQSEAYARAAREAQQQAQLRQERFDDRAGSVDDGYYTEGFRGPVSDQGTGPIRPRRLEHADDYQNTAWLSGDDQAQHTGRYRYQDSYQDTGRVPRAARPAGAGRKPHPKRTQGLSVSAFFLRLLRDFFGSFRLLFSRRPMNSFHQELSWQGIGTFIGLNVIFCGLLFGSLFTRSLKVLAGSVIGTELSVGKVFFRMFAFGLLGQIVFQLVVFGLLVLFSALLQSERRTLKQFAQTIAISSLPLTVIWFTAIIFSLFLSSIAFLLLFAAQIMYYVFLYAGFQKGHPSRKMSPYWLFFLLIVVTLIMQYVFLRLGFPNQLTIGSI